MESGEPESLKTHGSKKRYYWLFLLVLLILLSAGLAGYLKSEVRKLSRGKEKVEDQGILYNVSSSVIEVDKQNRRLLVLVTSPKAFPGHGNKMWVKVGCSPEESILRLVDLSDHESMVSGGESGRDIFSFVKPGDVFKGDCQGETCEEILTNCIVLREKLPDEKN